MKIHYSVKHSEDSIGSIIGEASSIPDGGIVKYVTYPNYIVLRAGTRVFYFNMTQPDDISDFYLNTMANEHEIPPKGAVITFTQD